MQTLSSGSLLNNGVFRIERVLGQGGFGITYLATDLNLQRSVAIKEFFPKDFCDRDETTSHVTLGTKNTAAFVNRLKAKFLKEARNIAKFDHPNIIRIHAAFEENNTAYYVMEYIEGESLSSMVKRSGPLPEKRALGYIEKVGEALEYVHARRINHLDVKPANIMVRKSDDTPILIDFGLSKQYDAEGNQTSTMPPGFSHGFAPMEQYNEGGVKGFSPQTDLYSLAATLYYVLSDVVPPQATRLIEEQLTFPSSIHVYLLPTISKAMSSARPNRHETIREFLEDIRIDTDGKPMIEAETKINTYPQQKTTAKKPDLTHDSHSEEAQQISTMGIINGHEWIDLGLPSGIKWATCNLGALNENETGEYYSFGETKPKAEYSEESYKHKTLETLEEKKFFGLKTEKYIIAKYKKIGNISGKRSYDAARSNWGGSWRLPTKKDVKELLEKCEWIKTIVVGHVGYKVIGLNGNSIFLAGAGYNDNEEGGLVEDGEFGYYWTSNLDNVEDEMAQVLYFSKYGTTDIRLFPRYCGVSIRAVSD